MPVPANWRWLWEDPIALDEWRMPRNPSAMTSPLKTRQTEGLGRMQEDRALALRRQDAPLDWKFSGIIRDLAFETTLLDWAGRENLLFITDHLGRRWEVATNAVSIIPRRTGRPGGYRASYDVSVFVLGSG